MRLRWYGWAGLGIVVVAEICLFARQPFVAQWFTPLVWTGLATSSSPTRWLCACVATRSCTTDRAKR